MRNFVCIPVFMTVSIQSSREFLWKRTPRFLRKQIITLRFSSFFPTVSYIYFVKRVILLVVVHMSVSVLVCL